MDTAPSDRLLGVLLGTAAGDALGLPAEGLRPATIALLGWAQVWKHRFVLGRGMWSDDTEHTIMLAQALLASGAEPGKFTRAFASELRWWVLGLPAGTGLATARAIARLWMGVSPQRSGVFSAGNGPCMRAAIVGACTPRDEQTRRNLTVAQTRITHTDPKALVASQVVANIAARLSVAHTPPSRSTILALLSVEQSDAEWREVVRYIERNSHRSGNLAELLRDLGRDPRRGISGYCFHTVAAVVCAGIRHQWQFEDTVTELIAAGGDADTTAAIAGALCGALGGSSCVPRGWVSSLAEWPTRADSLATLATALSQNRSLRIRPRWSPPLLGRNLLFLAIVLSHGLVRLLPVRARTLFNRPFSSS